ncbi:unnamed protein product [Effrenium voratum]|nr:unnamed protein product [Effrenium voratum]
MVSCTYPSLFCLELGSPDQIQDEPDDLGQQCVIAMFLAGPQHMHQLPCVMGNKVSPMPGTPCAGTPSTSDDEVQVLLRWMRFAPPSPAPYLITTRTRRRRAYRAGGDSHDLGRLGLVRRWQRRMVGAGSIAAGLVCNPVSDFFAQHSEQRLQEQLRGAQQEVTQALEVLKGHVWDPSCHPTGCSLVQLALENAGL